MAWWEIHDQKHKAADFNLKHLFPLLLNQPCTNTWQTWDGIGLRTQQSFLMALYRSSLLPTIMHTTSCIFGCTHRHTHTNLDKLDWNALQALFRGVRHSTIQHEHDKTSAAVYLSWVLNIRGFNKSNEREGWMMQRPFVFCMVFHGAAKLQCKRSLKLTGHNMQIIQGSTVSSFTKLKNQAGTFKELKLRVLCWSNLKPKNWHK